MKTETLTVRAKVTDEGQGLVGLNFIIGDRFLFAERDIAYPLTVELFEADAMVERQESYWRNFYGIPESVIESMREQIRRKQEQEYDTLGRRVAEIVVACAALAAAVGALLWGKI